MIKFKYIIGANIELAVEANILPAEPDVNYAGGVEIISVKLPNGDDVETDDIYIRINVGPMYAFEPLNDLLEACAMEQPESDDRGNEP